MNDDEQDDLFSEPSPASDWDRDAAKRALDELFALAGQYRSSADYMALLRFISRFRFYAPFNAMLVNVQMPGATYVAPAHRWLHEHRRRIRPGAPAARDPATEGAGPLRLRRERHDRRRGCARSP
jgi:hypothetical protein